MKKKIMLDKQQLMSIGVIMILLLLIGTTYAFFKAASSEDGIFGIRVKTDTVDSLVFKVGENINISANQDTFALGKGDRTGTSFAQAEIKANSSTNHYETSYHLFFVIDVNEFHYTTKDKKAELVLSIKDPNGNIIEDIPGLKKVYDSNNTVIGLDITEAKGSFAIAHNHSIETDSYKLEKWDIEVRLVNLDSNQNYNAGKTFSGNVHITQENMNIYRVPEVNTLDIVTNDNGIELTVGAQATKHTEEIKYYYYGIKEASNSANYSLKFYSSKLTINDIEYDRTETSTYTFKNLKPNTAYDVYAFTEDINGFTSEIYNDTFTTTDYDYPKINNVTATNVKDLEFTLSVEAEPGKVGEISTYYYLCDVDSASEPYEYYETTETTHKCIVNEDDSTYKTKIYVKDSNNQLSSVYDKEVTTKVSENLKVSVNDLPNTILGNYKATLSSTNGVAAYDAKKGLIISSLSGVGDFDLTYSSSNTTLANHVISLNNTTQGNGKVVNEPSTDYRYEGKNPNNYVWFNNELWRIIGVFGNNTHGQSENLVKIIRENSIGGLAWGLGNESRSNDWSISNLKELLNTNYYNATDGSSSANCSGSSDKSPSNCDYRVNGIQDNYRGMVQEVTWKLGGHNTNSATASEFYNAERGITVSSGSNKTTTGYIGLMYPSDYAYGVLSSSCPRTTKTNWDYVNDSCTGQNWMHSQRYEWTITPYSSYSDFAFYIHSSGEVYYNDVSNGYATRPVLYLKASTYITGGEGTETNPYTIEMH